MDKLCDCINTLEQYGKITKIEKLTINHINIYFVAFDQFKFNFEQYLKSILLANDKVGKQI